MEISLYFLILLIQLLGVESVWQCRDMECLKMTRKGDHFRSTDLIEVEDFREVPYVAILQDEKDRVFCMGILIKSDRVLTIASCLHKEGDETRNPASIKIRYRSLDTKGGETKQGSSIAVHRKCAGIRNLFTSSCDFAIIRTGTPFKNAVTPSFVSMHKENIADAINVASRSKGLCVGVGLGRFREWKEKGNWGLVGEERARMLKFDLRLLDFMTCNYWTKHCCGPFNIFSPESVRCGVRGDALSACFGEPGSPVICEGRVFGLLKGVKGCTKTTLYGAFIFVGIDHGIEFIKSDYDVNPIVPSLPDLEKFNATGNKPNSLTNGTEDPYDDYGYSECHHPTIAFFAILLFFYYL